MSRADVLHWTPTDYLSDYKTRRLSLEEHGAYMLLLWHMWNDSDSQCEFPRDPLALASIWGVSPEAAMDICDHLTEAGVAVVKVIERKSGAVLQSKRLREQANAFEIARQKNAKAGRQSGAVRRANAVNNRSTGVEHTLNENEPTVVPCLGSPDVSEPEDQTPVSSTRKRSERGSYPQATQAIGYWSDKLGRKLGTDEIASVNRWSSLIGESEVCVQLGYAHQDGYIDNASRIGGAVKAAAERSAS